MILTLTLNPAIDKTVSADRLVFEDRAYILSRGETAGGRGINASTVLQRFGANTLAILPAGGESRGRLEGDLNNLGFPYEIVPIEQNVRTNLIITDRRGLAVKLNEPGPRLNGEELARIEETVKRHLPGASWLLLCGSLPPEAPVDHYRRLIQAAKAAGVRTLLDTDGEVLQQGLMENPTLVTPNRQEASTLLNKALITRQHFRGAVQRILEMGADSVILSLGSRGAIAGRKGGEIFEAAPPAVEALCPIGAGDALNAAFVWAMEQKGDFTDAVKWGVAAGTASATLPGMGFADLEATRAVYERVEVR